MKITLTRSVGLLLWCFCAMIDFLLCQSVSATQLRYLSLQEVETLIIEKHHGLKAFMARKQSSMINEKKFWAKLSPNVAVTSSLKRQYGEKDERYSSSLALYQKIPNYIGFFQEQDELRIHDELLQLKHQKELNHVITQARQSFVEWIWFYQRWQKGQENSKYLESLYQENRHRSDKGFISRQDFLRFEIEFHEHQVITDSYEREFSRIDQQLKLAIGAPSQQRLALEGSLAIDEGHPLWLMDVKQSQALLLTDTNHSLLHKEKELTLRLKDIAIEKTRGEWLPSLSLSAYFPIGQGKTSYFPTMTANLDWTVWSGGSRNLSYRQRIAEKTENEQQWQQQLVDKRRHFAQLRIKLQIYLHKTKKLKHIVKLRSNLAEQAYKRYRLGHANSQSFGEDLRNLRAIENQLMESNFQVYHHLAEIIEERGNPGEFYRYWNR